MKAPFRRAVLLAGLLCVPGCILKVGWGGKPDVLPEMPMGNRSSSTDPNAHAIEVVGLKLVNGKEEPRTLIARDGTTCTVSKDKYESSQIGTTAWCTWVDRRR